MSVAENPVVPVLNEKRQHDIADGCDTTIVTESAPSIFIDGGARLRDASGIVFNSRPTRYDLLSVPSLKHLVKERAWVDLLAEDIRMTVGLHRVEKVLIASLTVPHRPLIQRLREQQDIRARLRMKGFSIPRPRRAHETRTMALTCMDWRLHGPAGFGPYFATVYGSGIFSVFATAGAAKELAHDGPRASMAFSQLSLVAGKLDRLVLVSHTDCGRYGGSRAFANPEAEIRALTADLEAAKARIAAAFPKLTVKTAIAKTRGVRCAGVSPVGT